MRQCDGSFSLRCLIERYLVNFSNITAEWVRNCWIKAKAQDAQTHYQAKKIAQFVCLANTVIDMIMLSHRPIIITRNSF